MTKLKALNELHRQEKYEAQPLIEQMLDIIKENNPERLDTILKNNIHADLCYTDPMRIKG